MSRRCDSIEFGRCGCIPRALCLAVSLGMASGCTPVVGDSCSSSSDCSSSGDRLCDLASPGGYCTVIDCDDGTCPDGAVCVEYRFEPTRLASRWCMAKCGGRGDCRSDEDYDCITADAVIDANGDTIARVVDRDRETARFCGIAGASD